MKKMTKRTLALAMSTGMLLSNSVWAATQMQIHMVQCRKL